MKPGDHGSTFAGSPLVTRAAGTVFDIIRQPEFLQQVRMPDLRLEATTDCLSSSNLDSGWIHAPEYLLDVSTGSCPTLCLSC